MSTSIVVYDLELHKMSFNFTHILRVMPIGALATTMVAQPGMVVDVLSLDTELAEDDVAWNSCIEEVERKVGIAATNIIAYRGKPSTQASVLLRIFHMMGAMVMEKNQ